MRQVFESRSYRKRPTLFPDFARVARLFLGKGLTAKLLDDSVALYFFEGAVGFDHTRLDVFEEVEVHGFEIIKVELLDSERCDSAFDSFKTQLFFF